MKFPLFSSREMRRAFAPELSLTKAFAPCLRRSSRISRLSQWATACRKRSAAIVIAEVDIGTGLQEEGGGFRVVAVDGEHERGGTIMRGGVDIGSAL